ncbi:MAG: serine/threonine-protein kinase [Acidobacteriota bacterium]
MTRRRRRKIIPPSEPVSEPVAEEPKPKKKQPPRSETTGKPLENALEADPEFFQDPLIDDTLGKCRIEKLIGEGKTAVVYRAHYEPLKRTVAVKVLHDEMAAKPAVLRVFQQEGRAVAAIDHENVLKIYDVGEDKGKYFLVLELLRGQELRKLIVDAEEGRLGLREALEYTRQTAKGLAAAQRKNLIHRDIKPHNLVVEPDGTLKIVDFGLAAEAEGAFAGGRLGTPHYMSPEQCRGELATTASDVYALGITLYHMIAGKPPYAGAKTTEEIIERHLDGKRLEPEKVVKGLPGSVAELIRRMTRESAKQRPTADEVAETIEKMLKGGGKAKQRPAGAGARRSAARRGASAESSGSMLWVGVGGVVVLGLLAFILLGGKDDEPEPTPEPTVVAKKPTPVRKKEPEKKPEPKLEGDEALEAFLKEGEGEEKTGNFMEALHYYERVMKLSEGDKESPYYKRAKAARDEVREAIRAERGLTRKKRTTLRGSEKAGQEFEEELPDFRKRLAAFKVDAVRADLEALRDRTRKATTERLRIEKMLSEIDILTDMIGIVDGRATALGGGKEAWELYDSNYETGWIVIGADQSGVTLFQKTSEQQRVISWNQLEPQVAIDFLDALRSPTRARDAMRLGYYCMLLGQEEAADKYFGLAREGDPKLAKEIDALRGED